ncbi:MAG TPA: hypothetical protein VMS73_03670 [Anaerolineaceae bacterium]|nr:hypothetical protein [Anaerolineaceae bacterium]
MAAGHYSLHRQRAPFRLVETLLWLEVLPVFYPDVSTQFVCLTFIAALAVALAAERYQRPELHRSRSMVLANL